MSAQWIRQGLLLYWTVWTATVFASNVTDALRAMRLLPASWGFISGNYSTMIRVTNIYHTPRWVGAWLFSGVILWEAFGACSFGLALRSSKASVDRSNFNLAFAINLSLWAAFMIADEVLLDYEIENTHRSIFAAQLLTLAVLYLLPEDRESRSF